MFPLISVNRNTFHTVTFLTNNYINAYKSVMQSRGNVAAELVRTGRTPAEISDFLDKTLPLPQKPELPQSLESDLEEAVETA